MLNNSARTDNMVLNFYLKDGDSVDQNEEQGLYKEINEIQTQLITILTDHVIQMIGQPIFKIEMFVKL